MKICLMMWLGIFLSTLGCANPRLTAKPIPVSVKPTLGETVGSGITSRQPDRLLMSDNYQLQENPKLSRLQIGQDIELLVYALKFGYGGRKFVGKVTFDSTLTQLQSVTSQLNAPATSRELLEACDRALLNIPDNHLVMRSPTTGISKAREKRARVGNVGKNLNQSIDMPWALNFRNLGAVKIPVLSISALPAPEDSRWSHFKETVHSIMKSPFLIIDLRGNAGGSDVMGAWLASQLLGRKIESPYASIHSSASRETLALLANNWKLKILFNKLQKKPVPDYFEERLREKISEYQNSKNSLREEEVRQMAYEFEIEKWPDANRFQGEVALLTDAECASSCESIIEFFEQIPGAVTVGENTAGSVHFANVGMLILPNSQLMVQIASDFWRYKDNRYVERIGYAPQVRAKGDALEQALSIFAGKLKQK